MLLADNMRLSSLQLLFIIFRHTLVNVWKVTYSSQTMSLSWGASSGKAAHTHLACCSQESNFKMSGPADWQHEIPGGTKIHPKPVYSGKKG